MNSTFIIRESGSRPGHFAISISGGAGKAVYNEIIKRTVTNHGAQEEYILTGKLHSLTTFSSLNELVDHFAETPLGLSADPDLCLIRPQEANAMRKRVKKSPSATSEGSHMQFRQHINKDLALRRS